MRSIFSKTFYQLSFTNFLCIILSLGFAKISLYLFQEILSLVKIQKTFRSYYVTGVVSSTDWQQQILVLGDSFLVLEIKFCQWWLWTMRFTKKDPTFQGKGEKMEEQMLLIK